ncbi:MAG: topoisomerase C-terminal repeat-containing protein [Clostridia bacterium]|nr:topoisomerase C-terminal repeat-containing protein [Clostridia bacterium]
MTLIIAEKPSLGRNIAAGIGNMSRRDGYLEGGGYIVSWAFGHLFSLADIEAYSPPPAGKTGWSMDNLPCFPEKFLFELRKDSSKQVDGGVYKQFKILETLCNREDVDTIVNAGDADREGEIIVRLCISNALHSEKIIKRLWLPDQTPETVAAALSDMKDDAEYDNLASEGFARTYIDWLYGVNLTRYATLRTGALLRVGRVIVPIVKAVYDRDMAIKNFVPEKYYSISSAEETNGCKVELNSKKKFKFNEYAMAERTCEEYNACDAYVENVKSKKDTISPGKLYSLSKLQNVLGKKYKMSMAESLDIIQKLYEEGYLTYPRTNSEYLATAEKDKIKKIVGICANIGYPVVFKDKKTIFDDSKIESHSAITPTYKIPDKNRLTEKQMQVYSTVIRRFVAVFCAEECVARRVEMTVKVGELEEFTLKGLTILEKGWTKYDDSTQKDKVLPPLAKGDKVNIRFAPAEKETSPPKHYTIETLNNYLKNPFRDEKAAIDDSVGADDAAEYKAMLEGVELGTEATRTGIIDNARKSEYINLKKDVYTIMPNGIFLIESLERMKIVMDKFKTSEMGRELKKVYRGESEISDAVELAKLEIARCFKRADAPIEEDTDTGFFGDVVGKCPLCRADVVRNRYGYGCSAYKEGCKFSVNAYICSRAVSVSNMKLLLAEGRTSKIKGFTSRKGTLFDAFLRLENGKCVFDFNDIQRVNTAEN